MKSNLLILAVVICLNIITLSAQTTSFNLTLPTNGAFSSITPDFNWTSSSNVNYYQLYIDGILIKSNITSNNYQLDSSEAISSGLHTWYVIAIGSTNTQSNQTWSIIVENISPTAFVLSSPTNDSWTSNLQPTLTWSASSDANSGLDKYQLWIDGTLNRDNISSSVTSTTPLGNLSNGIHTWMIKAIDNVGNVRNSTQTWTIKIDNLPPMPNQSCLYFPGLYNSKVSIYNSNYTYQLSYNYTIEAWIKPIAGGTENPRIISKQVDAWGTDGDYSFYLNGTGTNRKITFWMKNYGDLWSTTYLGEQWYHIAVTISGNQSSWQVRLYINGVQENYANRSGTIYMSTNSLVFGRKGNGNQYLDKYKGYLDEVRFWNITKSQQEISEDMHLPLNGNESGLIGLWRFNEGFGKHAHNDVDSNCYGYWYSSVNYSNSPLSASDQLLLIPTNNQYVNLTNPLFLWNSAHDEGIGFEKYQLWIDNNLIQNTSDTILTLNNSLTYGSHNWKIKSFDSIGNNNTSSTRTFYIDNVKPNAFNLTSPTDSQIVSLPTPSLSWESTIDSTGGGGLRKYQLWINGTINRDSISISQTSASPSNVLPQGTYTWFVKAYDNAGNIRQSTETRTFYVDWQAPSTFTLIEPVNNTTYTVSRPLFKWHSSSDIGSGLDKYELYISGQAPIIISPLDTTKLLTYDLANGTYTWYVKAYDLTGAFTSSNIDSFTINVPLPGKSATPTGTTELCINSITTDYTTSGATNASSYIWEIIPSGAGTVNGSGLIGSVNWNSTFTGNAQIKVRGSNSVGNGLFSDPINVIIYPNTISGTITGANDICLGNPIPTLTLNGNTGSILKWQKRMNNGNWLNIVNINNTYSETPATEGLWEYRVELQSGVCPLVYSGITSINVLDTPNITTYISGSANVCQGESSVNYSIPSITNATSYIWTLPSGASGSSSTNSITIDYGTTAVSGDIIVKGQNTCGTGDSAIIAVTVNPLPSSAGTISGSANVCQGESSVNYSIPSITNATSYIWTLPSGASGSSSTNSITVDYGTTAVSGDIIVKGQNTCGTGDSAIIAVTVNPLPSSAGTISGSANVCQGESSVNYSIPSITNATSYIWTLQSGASGSSSANSITVDYGTTAVSGDIIVKGQNTCGTGDSAIIAVTVNPLPSSAGTISGSANVCQGESSVNYSIPSITNATSYIWTLPSGASGSSSANSITVDYGTTAVSGDIIVKGQNTCGTGDSAIIAVTVNPLPSSAGTISGSANVCQGESSVNYSIPSITNATSYIWTLPSGASGSSSANSITVDYGTTAVSGDIIVKGQNTCGTGDSAIIAVTVNPLPSSAGTISGSANVCQGESSVNYSIPSITNATSYIWTLPSGASGSSSANSITVDYGTTAVSGDIIVKGQNTCGTGDSAIIAVTVNPLPSSAGTISGSANVCQGESSVNYSIPSITNATSYIWTLPSGASGSSSANSITVDYGTTAVSGDIIVKGQNTCGTGDSAIIAVTVNPLPSSAGTISGSANVCQGESSVNYSIPSIPNATSYIWTLPSGASGSSSANSITVDYGTTATSGDIIVKGMNFCGTGDSAKMSIIVNIKPVTPIISIVGNILQSNATTGNQWYNQNGMINGAINSSYTVTVDGNYYVIVTINGCSSDTSNVISYVTNIESILSNKTISLYPNPASNKATLEMNFNGKTKIEIYDFTGRLVSSNNYILQGKNKIDLDVSYFCPGIYLVAIENKNGIVFNKKLQVLKK